MAQHKQGVTDLQMQLLSAINNSVSKPAYDTWFSDLNIDEIVDDARIVFSTTTVVKSEWLEIRYTDIVKSLLNQITNNEYDLSFVVRKSGANDSENASGIKLSGYQWLFEGENNDYDSEYKDYICDRGSNEILQLLTEIKEQQIIAKGQEMANTTPSLTIEQRLTRLEERLSKLEEKIK